MTLVSKGGFTPYKAPPYSTIASCWNCCTVEVVQALFDRYDPDGSGSLSYDEFIKGLFKLPDAPKSARAAGGDLKAGTGTSLPLPSERGGVTGANPNQSFARGRGGVTGGSFHSGGQASDRPGMPQRGSDFNKSSGIFR